MHEEKDHQVIWCIGVMWVPVLTSPQRQMRPATAVQTGAASPAAGRHPWAVALAACHPCSRVDED